MKDLGQRTGLRPWYYRIDISQYSCFLSYVVPGCTGTCLSKRGVVSTKPHCHTRLCLLWRIPCTMCLLSDDILPSSPSNLNQCPSRLCIAFLPC
ncbi:hypothetical protein KC331_g66 [Hortaea werneckii]|nr:hypothetical protein KC331_g66 [Hortaea werneckii]